ncbi:putative HTH-type transcriptional regulator YegW [Microbulbifer aggregans]|uniref:Putative HTH-type transcriptional regulator YegW n=1 Tax=Microbulbifer aggregans TaxID=1769779 RepID=A0A1C9WAW1_9GAMM|nr:GntR family transcriptional regulator [Microbulbifer aggregans]AOS98279.1 putative HTH-type transcriptional regulator YegW [Microbulbifer aggregans]
MDAVNTLFSKQQLESLTEESHAPLYYQLYALLKNAILNGTLEHGDQMPTELQLADAFSVSRITAKRAMDELAAESLVERRRGKGTHVIYEYKQQPVKAPLVGMLQEIESMARHSDVEVRSCEKLQPPAEIREELGLATGDTALLLERTRSRDGAPFGYYVSWTAGLKGKVTAKQFATTPRLEIFRKQGLEIAHVTQTLSAEAATAESARELETTVGAPLLSLTRRSYSKVNGKEQLVDILHVLYHPDRFKYQMDLKADEI